MRNILMIVALAILAVLQFSASPILAKAPWCDTFPPSSLLDDVPPVCAIRPPHKSEPLAPQCVEGICTKPSSSDAIISVRALPTAPVSLEDGTVLRGMVGHYAIVNIDEVTFGTPDSRQAAPGFDKGDGRTCYQVDPANSEHGWRHALFTLSDWHKLYPSFNLMINGNWFDVRSPFKNPYVNTCSNIFGPAYADFVAVSSRLEPDGRFLLDAIMFNVKRSADGVLLPAVIAHNNEMQNYSNPQSAVGGFIILRGGMTEISNEQGHPNKNDIRFARTGVGLSRDGKKLYVVVEQNGRFLDISSGLSARELALYLKHLGAWDAINLDNSGSSQLLFFDDNRNSDPTFLSLPGDLVDCEDNLKVPCSPSEAAEYAVEGSINRHRPVPNFLGIRVNPKVEKRSLVAITAPQFHGLATREIAGITWTNQNLDFVTGGSRCYDGGTECRDFGRLYNLEGAIAACRRLGPGWRLPTDADWKALADAAGGTYGANNPGHAGYSALIGEDGLGFNAQFGGKVLAFDDHSGEPWPSPSRYERGTIGYYLTSSPKQDRPERYHVYTVRSIDQRFLREDYRPQNYHSARCVWSGEE